MTHLSTELPDEVLVGCTETTKWDTQIVTTDGGHEVRNSRWSAPRRTFEVEFAPSLRDGEVYLAVKALYEEAQGSLHSFDFRTWTDETGATVIPVRFDSPLQIEGLFSHLDKIATFTLIEVRL